jgi:DNA ligase-1
VNKTFPPLYRRSNTGALLVWQISSVDRTVMTVHGQYGGQQQVSEDTIREGKNVGKANATTPEQQAEKEAEARWQKQKKKGYVESRADAEAGKVDEAVILGGIEPMLSINKSHPTDPILEKYLHYPCLEQPKLDGVCCIAMVSGGKATLWSRTRKPIGSMPHIVAELERLFPEESVIFHGELYNHEYKDRFEDLISIIRQANPDPEGLHKVVQLHVYDLPSSGGLSYHDRYASYMNLLQFDGNNRSSVVVPVLGSLCQNRQELLLAYEDRLLAGYEGSMAKNLDATYEGGKRSKNLLKMKEFIEGEATIIEALEGRGKDAGVASRFLCSFEGPNGAISVEIVMACSYDKKREYWERRTELPGKTLTFKYKRLTADGVPYIPVGKGIRDYE